MKRRLVLLIIWGHMCLKVCGGQIFDQAAQNKIGREENDNKTKQDTHKIARGEVR